MKLGEDLSGADTSPASLCVPAGVQTPMQAAKLTQQDCDGTLKMQ
jgi:hypothetical protein